ncbi:hypothetical protein HELRODRAFT_175186 [Helobdella robusta]|uniref:Uncharacterized protein n=1 Tax=Helobdella robusta TaxID=6412 RepID=T1F8Z3_HELRO|nr:hypothetical protein HELRODRAFT_175186 [Helobdella robusta]ESO01156.1 hypothetical protein HELRODRAFT_175186 [Helobdella robusta]
MYEFYTCVIESPFFNMCFEQVPGFVDGVTIIEVDNRDYPEYLWDWQVNEHGYIKNSFYGYGIDLGDSMCISYDKSVAINLTIIHDVSPSICLIALFGKHIESIKVTNIDVEKKSDACVENIQAYVKKYLG